MTDAVVTTVAAAPATGAPIAWVSAAVWVLLISGIVLAVLRLLLGPSLADRVVVLDLLASFSQGALALYAVVTDEPALLDVAIAIALLSFLGTIAFARYIERNVEVEEGEQRNA